MNKILLNTGAPKTATTSTWVAYQWIGIPAYHYPRFNNISKDPIIESPKLREKCLKMVDNTKFCWMHNVRPADKWYDTVTRWYEFHGRHYPRWKGMKGLKTHKKFKKNHLDMIDEYLEFNEDVLAAFGDRTFAFDVNSYEGDQAAIWTAVYEHIQNVCPHYIKRDIPDCDFPLANVQSHVPTFEYLRKHPLFGPYALQWMKYF